MFVAAEIVTDPVSNDPDPAEATRLVNGLRERHVLISSSGARENVLKNGDRVKIGPTIFKFLSGADVEAQYHEEIYRMTIIDGLTEAYNKLAPRGKIFLADAGDLVFGPAPSA